MVRFVAFAACALAFVFPSAAAAQQTVLNGDIVGLTLPLTLRGEAVVHLDSDLYTFSLRDQAQIHSFHVRGPYERPGVSDSKVNFGTAGPDGIFLNFQGTMVFENVQLEDGLYRWNCDLHSDMMHGRVSVGNYLDVEVDGDGLGRVTSEPAGITCSARCGLGFPTQGTPVTLTATPQAGHEFVGWTGPCSGPGPCTVAVSGLTKVLATFRKLPVPTPPPPPPAETAPATVKRVKVGVVAGQRVVTVTLQVKARTAALAQLRKGTTVVATARGQFAPGVRTLKLRVPKATKAGAATVRLSLRAANSAKTFVVSRAVKLPRVS